MLKNALVCGIWVGEGLQGFELPVAGRREGSDVLFDRWMDDLVPDRVDLVGPFRGVLRPEIHPRQPLGEELELIVPLHVVGVPSAGLERLPLGRLSALWA